MCGEHARFDAFGTLRAGSSPHVRGARLWQRNRHSPPGIIPACAGSTTVRCWPSPPRRDHPRMCGEHPWTPCCSTRTGGSSPHVRGALDMSKLPALKRGIIPACAGSTGADRPGQSESRDHPRMCGEHLIGCRSFLVGPGSSPHVRGAR